VPDLALALRVAAVVGAGVVSGLLFAFSLVVMRALRELPPAHGMRTMQRINVLILTPAFLIVFVGTAALCVGILAVEVRAWTAPGALWRVAGAAAYLVGPLGVTAAVNVPLNNRLASVPPERAGEAWPPYVDTWLRWNHVRTALGVASTALLAVGLATSVR